MSPAASPADLRKIHPDKLAAYEVLDTRFTGLWGDTRLEKLYGDARYTEGPLYVPAGRYLVFTDIPNDRILRWDETTGRVGVLREPAGFANGTTMDRQGRLVTCDQGPRRVSRTEHDGSVTVLAERFGGKRFNSPNDVVVAADDAVWFTDPPFGIGGHYEGLRAEPEIGGSHVYRVDPVTGEVALAMDGFTTPNGLAFSPDGSRLYVADTRANELKVFDVGPGGKLAGGEVFATCDAGDFDGLRLDEDGRVWAAAGDGVHCFAPDGTLLGKVRVPEPVANLEFGGPRRNRLFITATTSVYSIMLAVRGAKRGVHTG